MDLVRAVDRAFADRGAGRIDVSRCANASRRMEDPGTQSAPAGSCARRVGRARPRFQVPVAGRPGNGIALLADAAARGEPRDVSPWSGDDDASTARSARSEAAGLNQVLPRTRDQSSLTTT